MKHKAMAGLKRSTSRYMAVWLLCMVGITPSTTTTTEQRVNRNHNTPRFRDLQQEWSTGSSNNNSSSDVDDDVELRTVLVIRILEESEDTETSNAHHTQLNTILFQGNTTYLTTTTDSGIALNRTGVSVSEQFSLCSMGKINLLPLSTHSNGHIWDIVIDSSSTFLVTDRSDRSQWISAAAKTAYNLGYIINDDNDNENDQTPGLRSMANHVIVILPPKYPNEKLDFLASAEVNHSISVFDASLTNSLSMYMHELGHNIHLQHSSSGKDSELVYGDKTGYMGTSDGSSHYPLKCYNAAQHWQMNWYTNYRISLLSQFYKKNQKWTGRLQVNAFVDAKKLEKGSDHIVLVQIDTNTYLQFNRAKSFNVGTSMLSNEVVLIRDFISHTQLLKSMNMTNYDTTATYEFESNTINPNTNATINTNVFVQLCDIVIHNNNTYDDSNIDYAIVAIGVNIDGNSDATTTLCQSNFVTGSTYTGSGIPIYLTNSTKNHGRPKILDLDNFATKVYELNILLLLLIGCTIVFLIGWFIKLLFLCFIRFCCCGCKCIPGCGDSTTTTTTEGDENSITEEPASVHPTQQPANHIPQDLPKERRLPKRTLFRWRFPTRRNSNNTNRRQHRDDTESTETTPSQSSVALPIATAVQLY